MQTFRFFWGPKVGQIVGREKVLSPEFETSLKTVRYSWKIEFRPKVDKKKLSKREKKFKKCGAFLKLVGIEGVGRKFVLASFNINLAKENAVNGAYEFDSNGPVVFNLDKDSGQTTSGTSDFGLQTFHGLPSNVTIFRGKTAQFLCTIQISTEMFSHPPISEILSAEEDSMVEDEFFEEAYKYPAIRRDLFEEFVSKNKKHKKSNVTLISLKGIEFHCHRQILSAKSEVFKKMAETDHEVKLNDVNTKCLKEMLQFIYTKTISAEMSADFTLKCLEAAEKYDIKGMKNACESILLKEIDVENVLKIFLAAEKFGLKKLQNAAICVVIVEYDEIKDLQKWKTFVRRHTNLACLVLRKCVSDLSD